MRRENRLEGHKELERQRAGGSGGTPFVKLGPLGITGGGKTARGLHHVESRAQSEEERAFKTLEVARILKIDTTTRQQ